MNAGHADTRSPHLDLGDLIAEVNGQAIDDRAREHLTRCEHCRAEVNRWDLVAGGVRGLAAATPEVAQPARPRRTRPGVPAGPRRRTVLAASAAAAVVLLGAVGYAATTGLTRHASGTVLTSVGGCATLRQAQGTLEQVNGARLVIKTASGQPVTVTTTASTFVSMSGPLLSDITDGASVMVRGHRWLHPPHVQRKPGPGHHLRRHARRSTPRQRGPVAQGHHDLRPWVGRTGRDADGTSGGSSLAAPGRAAPQRDGRRLLARLDRRGARLRRMMGWSGRRHRWDTHVWEGGAQPDRPARKC